MAIDNNSAPLAVCVEEAAHRAGVGRGFLYQEFGKGHLRPRKTGRRTLITLQEQFDLKPTRVGACALCLQIRGRSSCWAATDWPHQLAGR